MVKYMICWQFDFFVLGSYLIICFEMIEQYFVDFVVLVFWFLFVGEVINVVCLGYVDGVIDSGVCEVGCFLGYEVSFLLVIELQFCEQFLVKVLLVEFVSGF